MTKKLAILFLGTSLLFSSNIDKKIQQNKQILNTNAKKEETTNLKIKELADKIEAQNSNIMNLEKDIKQINEDIDQHQKLLEDSKNRLDELKSKSTELIKEKTSNEEQIVDTIIEEFSISIALKLASENSLQELIDNEIYTLLSQHSKDKVTKLNSSYNLLSTNTKTNQKDIDKLSSYIENRQKTKEKLTSLKEKHSSSLVNLEEQHKSYQQELNKVVKQQESLKDLLAELNILKQAEERKRIEAEEEKRRKLQALLEKKNDNQKVDENSNYDDNEIQTSDVRNQKYAKSLNLDVRKIGSSTDGVKISRYSGSKTIAPLKSFKVIKNFGTYYDPIYKIKLFNESIVLKSSEPQAKVVAVLNGKVVYAKKNAGMLENVVIIQHENGIHTIYSHLDEISPTLVVGKWIKQGYVVGRVDESLMFQVTKDSSHIDPKELFKI